MSVEERKRLISKLEEKLNARVLSIVTGDRQGMETRIAPDLLPLITEHLSSMGDMENLALFIYTPGGDTIVGWGLVNLVRQYCSNLQAVIPFRALSCGTLIALGADSIVMGKNGLLSPIDPSVSSPFNPQAPGIQIPGQVSLLPISVEDMSGFIDLAKKEFELNNEESMISALEILAEKVHPLALGAVYRAREQTSSLARRLLLKHSDDEAKIDRIVHKLTQELPTHNYLIGRVEATNEIELDIIEASAEVNEYMWALYKEYERWLLLTSPYSAELDLGEDQSKRVRYERAAIESIFDGKLMQHVFVTDNELSRVSAVPPGMQETMVQIAARTVYAGWIPHQDGEAK